MPRRKLRRLTDEEVCRIHREDLHVRTEAARLGVTAPAIYARFAKLRREGVLDPRAPQRRRSTVAEHLARRSVPAPDDHRLVPGDHGDSSPTVGADMLLAALRREHGREDRSETMVERRRPPSRLLAAQSTLAPSFAVGRDPPKSALQRMLADAVVNTGGRR